MHFNSPDLPEIFRPPINRSMHELDRSYFEKIILISAATVHDVQNISRVRTVLEKSKDVLSLGSTKAVQDDDAVPGAKCVLLRPDIKADGKLDF